jgi:glycosyltransferase involved in cell wall biosynthesis
MKRILFYIRSFFGGGAEKVMLDYVRGLNQRGFDITVMVRRDEGDFCEQFHALEQEGVHIRQYCDWIRPGKNLFQKVKNAGLLKMADWAEFRCPWLFYRIAIREKFDTEIAFMHNEAAAIIASSSNRKSQKLLWVHTDLRRINTWKTYFKTRKRQRRYFSRYDKIICVSRVAQEGLAELLRLTENIIVLHNPVDREKIIELSKYPCPLPATEMPMVCAVGRLSWEKNFAMLLRVHKALIDRGILHRLVIVGDGPERKGLDMLIQELGVENSVIMTGYKSNPYPYIAAADMTICSSVYEGLHIASIESLVLGKPVVSCCNVVGEVFGDFHCSVITNNNQEALAQGLEQMLTDSAQYEQCCEDAAIRGGEWGLNQAVTVIESLVGGLEL